MAEYTLTDLRKPGTRAIWATWGFAAAEVAFSLIIIYQNTVIRRFIDGSADLAELEQSDTVITVGSLCLVAALIIAVIFNGRFIYLASRNAAAVNPDPNAIRPGWAVGWFFIPFANYVMPYRAMKETWTRLQPYGQVPGWFIVWWLSWVVMNIYDGILSNRTPPNNLPDYLVYNQTYIISGFLWLIPTYFFLRIIQTLRLTANSKVDVFA